MWCDRVVKSWQKKENFQKSALNSITPQIITRFHLHEFRLYVQSMHIFLEFQLRGIYLEIKLEGVGDDLINLQIAPIVEMFKRNRLSLMYNLFFLAILFQEKDHIIINRTVKQL